MSAEPLTGLQLAIALLAQIGDDDSDRAIAAVHAVMDVGQPEELPEGLRLAIQYCNIGTTQGRRNFAENAIRAEHAQRLTLQHHACDLAQTIAHLEAERDRIQSACDNMTRGWRADRDALERREVDFQEMLVAEHSVSGAYVDLRVALSAMDPPSTKWPELSRYVAGVARDIVSERDALRARLAEIEAQEPVKWAANSPHSYCGAKLYARPVPAQDVPTGERQAVLLTDDEMWDAVRHADADSRIEAGRLAANGLEVRRG